MSACPELQRLEGTGVSSPGGLELVHQAPCFQGPWLGRFKSALDLAPLVQEPDQLGARGRVVDRGQARGGGMTRGPLGPILLRPSEPEDVFRRQSDLAGQWPEGRVTGGHTPLLALLRIDLPDCEEESIRCATQDVRAGALVVSQVVPPLLGPNLVASQASKTEAAYVGPSWSRGVSSVAAA